MSSIARKSEIPTSEEYVSSGLSESEETVLNSNSDEDNVIFAGKSKQYEVDEIPEGIDSLTETNDLTVLKSQMSSDEIVSDGDILKTEELINQSKQAGNEDEQGEEEDAVEVEVYDYEAELTPHKHNQVVLSLNIWDILLKGSINLVLPFINGMMLGFGEILAHEIGFRYNWFGARVMPPRRMEERARQSQSKFL